jgi:hypothetical protein
LSIGDDYEKYIVPKLREKIQVGWRIRHRDIIVSDETIRSNKEIEFSSILSLEENKKRAVEFLKKLRELYLAKHLVDGNTLKQSLPLTSGNFGEDLG